MLEKLNQTAAIAARDGIQSAIETIERRIKIKLDDINQAARDYFVAQLKADKTALEQLKALRAQMHKRVFDAHAEELAAPRVDVAS